MIFVLSEACVILWPESSSKPCIPRTGRALDVTVEGAGTVLVSSTALFVLVDSHHVIGRTAVLGVSRTSIHMNLKCHLGARTQYSRLRDQSVSDP